MYMASTMVDQWLPGFRKENDIDVPGADPLVSIWMGNRSRIGAHYDLPDNIACSVIGRRRFTLFPPDQISNLYPGPLDFSPGGQAISVVDFHNPDYQRFPKFRSALENAQLAELEPGDAYSCLACGGITLRVWIHLMCLLIIGGDSRLIS